MKTTCVFLSLSLFVFISTPLATVAVVAAARWRFAVFAVAVVGFDQKCARDNCRTTAQSREHNE
jgi:hypothetical protein